MKNIPCWHLLTLSKLAALVATLAWPVDRTVAGVVINEFQATTSERQIRWNEDGTWQIGSGAPWHSLGFDDAPWATGTLPAGFGLSSLATNLASVMQNKSPTCYFRKNFTLTAGQITPGVQVSISVDFNDGFIAYINGREIARAGMGAPGTPHYADEAIHNVNKLAGAQEYIVPNAGSFLVPGENVLAIHAANSNVEPTVSSQSWGGQTSDFKLNASLRLVGASAAQTVALYNFDNATGATQTHINASSSVTNTSVGTPGLGGWLERAALPTSLSSVVTTTLVTTEAPNSGLNGSGALRYDMSQSGADLGSSVTLRAPAVSLATGWEPGNINSTTLANTLIRFRYLPQNGAALNFRIDPSLSDATNVINGFPVVGGTFVPTPDYTFADATNGTVRLTMDASGGNATSNIGTLRDTYWPYASPDLISGIFSWTEDGTVQAIPPGGTNGVLKLSVDQVPSLKAGGSQQWWGVTIPNKFSVPEWNASLATLDNKQLTRTRFSFRWKFPLNKRMGVFFQTPSGGYNNRLDFGTFTGTGNWETFDRSFDLGTNLSTFQSHIRTQGTSTLQLTISQVDNITSYATGDAFYFDDLNLYYDAVGASPDSAPVSFSDAANGGRRLTCNATTGTQSLGTVTAASKNTLTPFASTDTRALVTISVEDATVGGGAEGSKGHLRHEVTTVATAGTNWGLRLPNYSVRSWMQGAVTAADLASTSISFMANVPAGQIITVGAEPQNASAITTGEANRIALGNFTGTGAWASYSFTLGSGSNQAAFLTSINAVPNNKVILVFTGTDITTLGVKMRLDNVNVVYWKKFEVALNTGTQGTTGRRFIDAMNTAGSVSFVPTFYRTDPIPTAGISLLIEDFEVVYSGPNLAAQIGLVPLSAPGWKYKPGIHEPSGGVVDAGLAATTFIPPLGEEDDFDNPKSFVDWVELYNDSASPQSLNGWGLTNNPSSPLKWIFPAGTSIPANGRLLVLCDGREEANAPAGPATEIHASFALSGDGDFLGLSDPNGTIVDSVSQVPSQVFWSSYGRQTDGTGPWGFLTQATPRKANFGAFSTGRVSSPDFLAADGITSFLGGRYTGAQTLVLAYPQPPAPAPQVTPPIGYTIRYTLDGSEPTLTNGLTYSSPLTLQRPAGANGGKTANVVRARAYATDKLPSGVKTQTYLIDQDAAISGIPAMIFTGEAGRNFYKPWGLMAINEGARDANALWLPNGPNSYNYPVGRGQAFERETHLEWYFNPGYYPDATQQPLREDIGLRLSSSPYSRPRLTMASTAQSPFDPWNPNEKCSYNLSWRGDFGGSSLDYRIFPGYDVKDFQNLRLRAGKNDIGNPMISDEFMRRLWIDMDQVGVKGLVCTLYINGQYKGLYNLAERIREPMLQAHYRSDDPFEVRYVGEWVNGTTGPSTPPAAYNDWQSSLTTLKTTPSLANYQAVESRMDVENFADYYLFCIYTAMWDWPWNNYAFYRQQRSGQKWKMMVWDAEGGMLVNSYYTDYVTNVLKNQNYNTISLDLTGRNSYDLPRWFDQLRASPEWRLKMADRVAKQFHNNGALDDRDPDGAGPLVSNLQRRFNELAVEAGPVVQYNVGAALSTAWVANWTNTSSGRRSVILPKGTKGQAGYAPGHLRAPTGTYNAADTFWPETEPPVFSQHGGDVPLNYALSITGSVAGVAGGVMIHYTLDGSDPRLPGGTMKPGVLTYSSAITLTQSVTIKARSMNTTTQEWSPLTEATFRVAAQPATAQNLVIAEIMYQPPDSNATELANGWTNRDDFEFVRLQNIGGTPVKLDAVKFTIGVTFDFALGDVAVIEPGASVLVVRNKAAFRQRYGTSYDGLITGEFTGGLSNGGERLVLIGADGADADTLADTLRDFAYGDAAPWPNAPDGDGPSLMLLDPISNPDHSVAANWTASAYVGGLPGGVAWAQGYSAWRGLRWGTTSAADEAISGPTADPDGDGVSNLLEYVLGAAPKDAKDGRNRLPSASVVEVAGQRYLQIDFKALTNTGGVTLSPEVSNDLRNWTAATLVGVPMVNNDGTTSYQYRDPLPIETTQRHYIQLRVTAQ